MFIVVTNNDRCFTMQHTTWCLPRRKACTISCLCRATLLNQSIETWFLYIAASEHLTRHHLAQFWTEQ